MLAKLRRTSAVEHFFAITARPAGARLHVLRFVDCVVSHLVMCGRRPHRKRNLTSARGRGASHVSGLLRGTMTACPDPPRLTQQIFPLLAGRERPRSFPVVPGLPCQPLLQPDGLLTRRRFLAGLGGTFSERSLIDQVSRCVDFFHRPSPWAAARSTGHGRIGLSSRRVSRP
jgi:hypothetical protein